MHLSASVWRILFLIAVTAAGCAYLPLMHAVVSQGPTATFVVSRLIELLFHVAAYLLTFELVFGRGQFWRRLVDYWMWIVLGLLSLLVTIKPSDLAVYGLQLAAIGLIDAQAPLWAMRLLFSWRIAPGGEAGDDQRWSIRDFGVGILIGAIASAIARIGSVPVAGLAISLAYQFAVSALIAAPAVPLVLGRSRRRALGGTALIVVTATLLLAGPYFSRATSLGFLLLIALKNATSTVAPFAAAWLLRALGYRLVERPTNRS